MKTSNIEVTKGDTETVVIPVEDGDVGGFVATLNTNTVRYQITDKRGAGSAIISKTDSDSAVTFDTASNINSTDLDDTGIGDSDEVILIDLSSSDTDQLTDSVYYHECELDDGTEEKTVMIGSVEVSGSAT